MPVQALTVREAKPANNTMEMEAMLRLESFPLDDDEQQYKLHPASSVQTNGTEIAVERALYFHSIKKALGLDKLPFGAVHLLWKCDTERTIGLANGKICTGRHLAVRMGASGVMVRTARKDHNM